MTLKKKKKFVLSVVYFYLPQEIVCESQFKLNNHSERPDCFISTEDQFVRLRAES